MTPVGFAKVRVWAIVGPTAAGKSAAGVAVAERLGAEVVSVDSMQLYRGLDAGTDKPDAAMRARVPHHLLDVFEPSHDVTVAEFQRLARAAIADIAARGRVPLLVGGSGLYFRAVVDDLRFPPRAPEIRARLEDAGERLGPEALHARLASLDPAAAARIEPANLRRTVRALEVIEATGRRFSDEGEWDRFESVYDLTVAGVSLDRPALYDCIARRVDRMLAAGLVAEARCVRDLGRTARHALGYRQILDAPPDATEAEVRAEIVRATKRFARRQESWFRADPRIAWLPGDDPAVADRIADLFAGAGSRGVR